MSKKMSVSGQENVSQDPKLQGDVCIKLALSSNQTKNANILDF